MKQLGDLTLPESIQWTDRRAWSPVAMETARTLGGTPVLWSQPLIKGRPITLEAADGVTWLDQSTVMAIEAMAAQSGVVFPLIWGAESYQVMFRHHEPPAIQFQPIWPHHDLYTGTIKLFEV
ncbi:putative transmembrane protein [Magnetococcus marinus MC-1]|uniref:Putative transmembrane protein n=1 Tax=Magnetococcus marinus (strain ATCC BAA-1437 / JCM 17883 / MC-1) TaxID=156889 RepID=A0L7A7_MAGMM|nr:hypothetical protein [Magnetococcus marinus]ABK43850.1 putative transmembrane protein [Magnetococcus marinus MC-1]